MVQEAPRCLTWVDKHVIKLTLAAILLVFLLLPHGRTSDRGSEGAHFSSTRPAHRRRLDEDIDWGGAAWEDEEWEVPKLREYGKRKVSVHSDYRGGKKRGRGGVSPLGLSVEEMSRTPVDLGLTSVLARGGLLPEGEEEGEARSVGQGSGTQRRRKLDEGAGFGWDESWEKPEGRGGDEVGTAASSNVRLQDLVDEKAGSKGAYEGDRGVGSGEKGAESSSAFRHKYDLPMSLHSRAEGAEAAVKKSKKRRAFELGRRTREDHFDFDSGEIPWDFEEDPYPVS